MDNLFIKNNYSVQILTLAESKKRTKTFLSVIKQNYVYLQNLFNDFRFRIH